MSYGGISDAELAELMEDPEWLKWYAYTLPHRRDLATVYFVRCEQYVKIGISTDPAGRLKQIRKGSGMRFPRRLDIGASEMVATEPGGIDRERELHGKFSHLRHSGEWFTEAPDLTEYIESLGVTK